MGEGLLEIYLGKARPPSPCPSPAPPRPNKRECEIVSSSHVIPELQPYFDCLILASTQYLTLARGGITEVNVKQLQCMNDCKSSPDKRLLWGRLL